MSALKRKTGLRISGCDPRSLQSHGFREVLGAQRGIVARPVPFSLARLAASRVSIRVFRDFGLFEVAQLLGRALRYQGARVPAGFASKRANPLANPLIS